LYPVWYQAAWYPVFYPAAAEYQANCWVEAAGLAAAEYYFAAAGLGLFAAAVDLDQADSIAAEPAAAGTADRYSAG